MELKNDMEKIDDVMLPGFRFHPTDEELVDFYLKRKIQNKSLPIEMIKQVDIYKYDPWDLPKELASSGEKEWYFYCPRDRKYKNSVRPNRVTRTGFWKATGTDRPICSSQGKCIGLKKSLVFYRGRASKGIKTDWMMHEFRLPCISDSSRPTKSFSEKSITASDSWAICRIFKKTTSMSMAQKALSQSWFSQFPGTMDILTLDDANCNLNNQFNNSDNNISSCPTTKIASSTIQQFQHQQQELHQLSPSDIPSYKPIISNNITNPNTDDDSFMFCTLETIGSTYPIDCIGFEDTNNQHYSKSSGFSINLPQDMQMQGNMPSPMQLNGFPFNLPPNDDDPIFPWESHPCPNDMSTNKCYMIN
ncbi:unnamed protein product [Lupinus luteus]|uniref:NAC domain-containing protein n=1 Tax=Lupinus luteus TaxID=3873 RepID=A0AAV1XL70_LUPLU